jgi:RNA 2',3'-cyclic 3'-phosphodiesterase
MGEKKRLFLAVSLGVSVTRKIGDAVAKMRAAADRRGLRVGWVPPANLHLTLKFLGWSSGEVVDAVRDRVAVAAAGVKAFELSARGTGGFPSDASARILYVGLADPGGVLAPLAECIDARMVELGFAAETRPFAAHITIGRVKEGSGTDELIAPWKQTDFGTSPVREIVLYESFTKSSGSEYMAQFRLPLVGSFRQTREVEGSKESEDSDGG